jgi:single-strand DNA-binding protein
MHESSVQEVIPNIEFMVRIPKGTAVCHFTVACNRFWKQEPDQELQKEVSFVDVTCWLRLAEVCGEFLKKGRGVRVVGRLKQDRWTDAHGKPPPSRSRP